MHYYSVSFYVLCIYEQAKNEDYSRNCIPSGSITAIALEEKRKGRTNSLKRYYELSPDAVL